MHAVISIILAGLVLAATRAGAATPLPAPASTGFCIAAQQILANTTMVGDNTVFTDMPSYRASKPMVEPLEIFQVVTYRGRTPIVVSCKIKGAAHLRAAYGEPAAGEQRSCPEITRRVRDQTVRKLTDAGDADAAARVAGFVIDATEPYLTGRSYLADFQPSYTADDGTIHIASPGLFIDYDSWMTILLPERFEGQQYCHLPTVDYLEALATDAMQPGTVITTTDDAPTVPQ